MTMVSWKISYTSEAKFPIQPWIGTGHTVNKNYPKTIHSVKATANFHSCSSLPYKSLSESFILSHEDNNLELTKKVFPINDLETGEGTLYTFSLSFR